MVAPITLRPYQEEAVKAVWEKYAAGEKRVVLVLATGTGKTSIFSEIARRCLEKGNAVLVLAHRGELIEQAAARLELMCGIEPSIEKAEAHYDGESSLCVASVQTLQGERLDAFPLDRFSMLVIDEAHHSVSDSYRRIIDAFDGWVLGVTATADRADKRGLAEVYESIAYEYPLARAVADGYLSPIRAKCLPLSIDISDVKVSHGDYQAGELGDALEPYLPEIARVMASECAGRKTVCFLPLVATAERMAAELNAAGLSAVAASGYDSAQDRADKKDAFEHGDYQVLCNSMLYTEGWDCPAVDCIAVLRPTKSRSLYAQMVGRGTRLSPETGKDHLLLLDFLWMSDKHDLARPASLLGKEPRVAQRMAEIAEEGAEDGKEWGLDELASQAEKDVIAEREAALAAELERQRRKKKKFVDPLQFAISIQDLDLADYVPQFVWECKEPTDKQRAAIEKFGVDADGIENAGQASALLDALYRRQDSGLARPKQIRCLEKYGFKHVGTWSFEAANDMISRIAAAGWKIWRVNVNPEEYDPRNALERG